MHVKVVFLKIFHEMKQIVILQIQSYSKNIYKNKFFKYFLIIFYKLIFTVLNQLH